MTAVHWRAEAWAVHIANGHQCCGIVGDDRCGLMCGHDGDHTPHQVGAYLPPPLIRPLGLLPLQTTGLLLHCPLCGARAESIECRAGILAFRNFGEAGREPELEAEWIFWPCGCEGREILPGEDAQP